MRLESRHSGVTTSREFCFRRLSATAADFVLNSGIIRHDERTKEGTSQRLHEDIVSGFIQSHVERSLFVSVSFSGELMLWTEGDGRNLYRALLDRPRAIEDFYTEFSVLSPRGGRLMSIGKEKEEGRGAEVVDVIFRRVRGADGEFSGDVELRLRRKCSFGGFVSEGEAEAEVFLVEDGTKKTKARVARVRIDFARGEVEELGGFDLEGLGSSIWHLSFNNDENWASQGAFCLYSRQGPLCVVDGGWRQLAVGRPGGKPGGAALAAKLWGGEWLLMGSDCGKLWLVKLLWDETPRFSVIRSFGCPTGPICLLEFATGRSLEGLWMATVSHLFRLRLSPEGNDFEPIGKMTRVGAEVTCSALASSSDSSLLALADFAGRVAIFSAESPALPLFETRVGDVPRSLALVRAGNDWTLAVGSLCGRLMLLRICLDRPAGVRIVGRTAVKLVGGVLTLHPNHSTSRLCAGTSEGRVAVLEVSEPLVPTLESCFLAHKVSSGPEDLRFGSLGKFAEVWCVRWCPDGRFLATCSEDQTTSIWTPNGQLVTTLLGHSSAVTCLDWVFLPQQDMELLITCADDQKVIVWLLNEPQRHAKQKWTLLHLFSSKEAGANWHTLTYLRVLRSATSNLVVVAAQNGFIFVFDFVEGRLVLAKRVHFGSIEGLTSLGEDLSFATCSSDCSLGLFKLLPPPTPPETQLDPSQIC